MFEGIHTALVTPFRESDGEVDASALAELCERQIAAGIDGLVPCGSTGESATLSHAEHGRVIEVVVAAARGRVRVVAGAGSNSTQEAIGFTLHAKEAGADGALLISPYYNKPTQAGIVAHYRAIAAATAFPLLVYNIPARTSRLIEVGTLAEMAQHPKIVATKDAVMDVDFTTKTRLAAPADFAIYSGQDSYTIPMMSAGAIGVVSVAAHVIGRQVKASVAAANRGDFV